MYFNLLTFCVLSSKSIIIYTEKPLAALSFLTFVVFRFHNFGNTRRQQVGNLDLKWSQMHHQSRGLEQTSWDPSM